MRVIVQKTKISPWIADFFSLEVENDSVDDEVCLEGTPYEKQNKDLFTHEFISWIKRNMQFPMLGAATPMVKNCVMVENKDKHSDSAKRGKYVPAAKVGKNK